MLFARAVLPVHRFCNMGVRIGLGTDIAGGHSPSMVDSMRMAGLISRIEGFNPPVDRTADPFLFESDKTETSDDNNETVVDYKKAFHMATRGGALALGLQNIGVFEIGMQWDSIEVDLTWDEDEMEDLCDATTATFTNSADDEDILMKFERWISCSGGEHSIRNVWVNGKFVFSQT
jgi:guanine deaminase